VYMVTYWESCVTMYVYTYTWLLTGNWEGLEAALTHREQVFYVYTQSCQRNGSTLCARGHGQTDMRFSVANRRVNLIYAGSVPLVNLVFPIVLRKKDHR
jgi:hypothetical protein